MTNLPEYSNQIDALDKVQQGELPCPYKCRIAKPNGQSYEAEITVSTQGYCLSAVEAERVYKDVEWLEYLERRSNETNENTETQQSPST